MLYYWNMCVCPSYQYGLACVCVTIQVKPGSWDFPVAAGDDSNSAGAAARRAVPLGPGGTVAENTNHNPVWMGSQVENNPAVSARHGEGMGAMFSPSKITNCLSSRQVSCCSQMFTSCFLWKIALAGFAWDWRVELAVSTRCSWLWRWLWGRLVQRRQWTTGIQNSDPADFAHEIVRHVGNDSYDQEDSI